MSTTPTSTTPPSTTTSPVYLDYNSACPMDEKVREVVKKAVDELWADPSSRSTLGRTCKDAIEDAREKVAKMIDACPEEIVFTSGGTESNHMVVFSAIQAYYSFKAQRRVDPVFEETAPKLDPVPHIVSTGIENPSMLGLLAFLESKRYCQVTKVTIEASSGAFSEFEVMDSVRPNTCLISLVRANGETGVIQPVNEVGQLLQDKNAKRKEQWLPMIKLHTDASLAVGKIVIGMREETSIDYMTIEGDKFYGPRVGALFVRKQGSEPFYPMMFGGGQEKALRPGLEPTPMIVGLGKAAEIVTERLRTDMHQMNEIRDHLEKQLLEVFGGDVVINCNRAERLPNTSSVTFKFWRDGSALELLAACKRFVASTAAFPELGKIHPSPVLVASGVPKSAAVRTVRFSVGRETTVAEICEVVKELCEKIGPTKK